MTCAPCNVLGRFYKTLSAGRVAARAPISAKFFAAPSEAARPSEVVGVVRVRARKRRLRIARPREVGSTRHAIDVVIRELASTLR
jgi:hypothetical protein